MKPAFSERVDKKRSPILSSALDFVPIGHLVVDRDFTVIFWNRNMESWTGISRKTILKTNLFRHFMHLDVPKYRERIAGVFKGGPPVIFSSQLHMYLFPSRLPNGNQRIQHTTITSILDPHSDTYLALFSIQDVTNLTDALETNRKTHLRDE